MDLAYQTQNQIQQPPQNHIATINKKLKSTIWSIKQIPLTDQNLSPQIRQQLINLIQKDKVSNLRTRIDKIKINIQSQLGSRGSKWSFLHFCAKWDASKILEYLLKYYYKQQPNDYVNLVNARTLEGLSPLMVAIINDSKNCMKILLLYGGVDIFLVDNNKLTSYQIALTNKNQAAIKLLIQYQQQHKVSDFLNTQKLEQVYKDQQQECDCLGFVNIFINWLTRTEKNKDILDQLWQPKSSERRCIIIQKQISYHDPDFMPALNSICENTDELQMYQIQWMRPNHIFSLKQVKLFYNYNAFAIKQLNFCLKHNLIIFQCLARNPWILRKKIFQSTQNEGMYTIQLFPNNLCKRILIDDYIPCFKDKKEPMFLYSDKQLWPMLLQKAWVKCHKNYVNCRNIKPQVILQQLTGFHSQTFNIKDFQDNFLFSNLKKIYKNNRIIVLTTKENSELKQDNQGIDTFTILNFYQKQNKKLYLVNCPFRLPEWKSKQQHQFLALRLIKAHFNSHNQMSIWIDHHNLKTYFQRLTISYIDSKLLRSQLKSKSTGTYFFKFNINSTVRFDLSLKLYEIVNENEYRQIKLNNLEVSRNERISGLQFSEHLQSFGAIKCIDVRNGEYFCKVDLPDANKLKDIVLIGISPYKICFEYIDQQLGMIQWMCLLRDKFQKSPMNAVNQFIQSKILLQGKYLLVIVKQKPNYTGKSCLQLNNKFWKHVIHGYAQGDSKMIGQRLSLKCWYVIVQLNNDVKMEDLNIKYIMLE